MIWENANLGHYGATLRPWRFRYGALQFHELVSNRRVDSVGEFRPQLFYFDEFLNVSKIFQTMRSTHTRSEFELDQPLKRDCLNAIDLNRYVRRIWKSDWFRQAIARVFSGRNNLNANVSLRGAKLFSRALKSGTITEPDKFFMKPRQALFGKQQVDVLGEAPVSVLIQGHRANHDIVNSAIFQRPRDSF